MGVAQPPVWSTRNRISNTAPQLGSRYAHAFAADRDRVADRNRRAMLLAGFSDWGPPGSVP